jgi:hypothetical protein
MRGTIPPLPQYVFMAWCLVKQRDNFIFTFLCRTEDLSGITTDIYPRGASFESRQEDIG